MSCFCYWFTHHSTWNTRSFTLNRNIADEMQEQELEYFYVFRRNQTLVCHEDPLLSLPCQNFHENNASLYFLKNVDTKPVIFHNVFLNMNGMIRLESYKGRTLLSPLRPSWYSQFGNSQVETSKRYQGCQANWIWKLVLALYVTSMFISLDWFTYKCPNRFWNEQLSIPCLGCSCSCISENWDFLVF